MNASLEEEGSPPRHAQGSTNPCTLCAPLGAALASAGIAATVPLLHGAQGCATYIRRYLISHFREPLDVASSSFGETETVFGGESNLARALDNIVRQYSPALVTVATTCLAETIGEDVPLALRRYAEHRGSTLPVVHASTPSYKDGHVEGFHAMVHAVVKGLALDTGPADGGVNVLPPLLSPADLRHLREIVSGFGVPVTLLPDYADTLDGVIRDEYHALPSGGTPLEAIRKMPRAGSTLDLTLTGRAPRASSVLEERGSKATLLGVPVGVRATDAFVDHIAGVSGAAPPPWLTSERGRLLDAYADGHKYVYGKRVGVYGDPELVVALARFLAEVGARPVLCATGARNRTLGPALAEISSAGVEEVLSDTDFATIEARARTLELDLLMGSSKGYRMARALGVPLLRVGFPIHDRFGAGRLLHVGYRGTAALLDAIVNALLEEKQEASTVGFSYL